MTEITQDNPYQTASSKLPRKHNKMTKDIKPADLPSQELLMLQFNPMGKENRKVASKKVKAENQNAEQLNNTEQNPDSALPISENNPKKDKITEQKAKQDKIAKKNPKKDKLTEKKDKKSTKKNKIINRKAKKNSNKLELTAKKSPKDKLSKKKYTNHMNTTANSTQELLQGFENDPPFMADDLLPPPTTLHEAGISENQEIEIQHINDDIDNDPHDIEEIIPQETHDVETPTKTNPNDSPFEEITDLEQLANTGITNNINTTPMTLEEHKKLIPMDSVRKVNVLHDQSKLSKEDRKAWSFINKISSNQIDPSGNRKKLWSLVAGTSSLASFISISAITLIIISVATPFIPITLPIGLAIIIPAFCISGVAAAATIPMLSKMSNIQDNIYNRSSFLHNKIFKGLSGEEKITTMQKLKDVNKFSNSMKKLYKNKKIDDSRLSEINTIIESSLILYDLKEVETLFVNPIREYMSELKEAFKNGEIEKSQYYQLLQDFIITQMDEYKNSHKDIQKICNMKPEAAKELLQSTTAKSLMLTYVEVPTDLPSSELTNTTESFNHTHQKLPIEEVTHAESVAAVANTEKVTHEEQIENIKDSINVEDAIQPDKQQIPLKNAQGNDQKIGFI